MANRTQIVCLHEGKKGRSIDPLFIRTLVKALDPSWIRPWPGNSVIRTVACGGRTSLIAAMPDQLRLCLAMGGDTTLMVWADADDDMAAPDQLKTEFRKAALDAGITAEQFEQVVFVFAKDRLENWIQFLNVGATDESREGPRLKYDKEASDAARKLANHCSSGALIPNIPPSLEWSCRNWRKLVQRMK